MSLAASTPALLAVAATSCVDHTLTGPQKSGISSRATSGPSSRPSSRPAKSTAGKKAPKDTGELLGQHGGKGAKKVLEARAAMPDWTAYDALLKRVVKKKRVDYAAVRKEIGVLDRVLADIAKTDVAKLDKAAQVVLCINAYNAATLKLVVEHVLYRGEGRAPLAGVLEVKKNGGIDFFDSPQVLYGGKKLSLNALEKGGRDLGDPRIHFAVNCASVSCPPLLGRAWRTKTLEKDLDDATRAYLRSPEGLQIQDGRVFLSKIFEWYAGDWGGAEGVKNFLRLHADNAAKERLDRELGYLEYDWNVNAQR